MAEVVSYQVPPRRPKRISLLGIAALVIALLSCPPLLLRGLKAAGILLNRRHFASPGWDIGMMLLILTAPTCLSFVFCLFACARIGEKSRRLRGMAFPVVGVLVCVMWVAMAAGIGLSSALPRNVDAPQPSESGQ